MDNNFEFWKFCFIVIEIFKGLTGFKHWLVTYVIYELGIIVYTMKKKMLVTNWVKIVFLILLVIDI